jgi:hypothetical protein
MTLINHRVTCKYCMLGSFHNILMSEEVVALKVEFGGQRHRHYFNSKPVKTREYTGRPENVPECDSYLV